MEEKKNVMESETGVCLPFSVVTTLVELYLKTVKLSMYAGSKNGNFHMTRF